MVLESQDFYFFYRHEFGQWTLRDMFDERGRVYNCCEQYMMHRKAMLFGDYECAARILAERNPRLQKALGRKVRGFIQAILDSNKEAVVYEGNRLKFTQHKDLKLKLLATHPKTLVEASPTDLVWGVGLSGDDPLILDSRNWRGQNLLGRVLTKLREDLLREERER